MENLNRDLTWCRLQRHLLVSNENSSGFFLSLRRPLDLTKFEMAGIRSHNTSLLMPVINSDGKKQLAVRFLVRLPVNSKMT